MGYATGEVTGTMIGGSTGAVDNAVLAADGTGGETVQARAITVSDVSGSSVTLATTAGNALAIAATAPTQAASTQAGVSASVTASAAVAGSANAGAAAGGSVAVTAGAAARLTSGDAAGGDITLRPGAPIGTGADGRVLIASSAGTARLQIGDLGGSLYGMSYPGGTARLAFSNDGTTSFLRTDNLEISTTGNSRYAQLQQNAVKVGLSTILQYFSHNDPAQGSADTGVSRAAAGVVAIGTGTLGSATGKLLTSRLVEANVAGSGSPNLLAVNESRTLLTNEGATAENYHTLPLAAVGLEFIFYCHDADGIRVTANTADTIRLGASVSAAAGYVRSSTIGSCIVLVAINATEWIATSIVGTWTVDS